MNKTKMISLKRISKDIQEITKNPVEGIGIIQYESDFFKYIVNIKLLYGVYKGFCLQLLLTFSDSYPTKPPKILIFPGQNFDGSYQSSRQAPLVRQTCWYQAKLSCFMRRKLPLPASSTAT